jgi:hypothetical protein
MTYDPRNGMVVTLAEAAVTAASRASQAATTLFVGSHNGLLAVRKPGRWLGVDTALGLPVCHACTTLTLRLKSLSPHHQN